jgi:hypothetical protein
MRATCRQTGAYKRSVHAPITYNNGVHLSKPCSKHLGAQKGICEGTAGPCRGAGERHASTQALCTRGEKSARGTSTLHRDSGTCGKLVPSERLVLQEDIREIVEVYDECLHGSLDGPVIRDEVHRQRQYFGPPRKDAERRAEEQALEEVQRLVDSEAPDEAELLQAAAPHPSDSQRPAGGKSEEQEPLVGVQVYQDPDQAADSDDDSPHGPVASPVRQHHSEFQMADSSTLDAEVERLMAALQQVPSTDGKYVAAQSSCRLCSSPSRPSLSFSAHHALQLLLLQSN